MLGALIVDELHADHRTDKRAGPCSSPGERTVPHLLPESDEFTALPNVLATGYLVGWTIKVETTIHHIDHRAVTFEVKVTDDRGRVVCTGTHRRGVVDQERFLKKLDAQEEARATTQK